MRKLNEKTLKKLESATGIGPVTIKQIETELTEAFQLGYTKGMQAGRAEAWREARKSAASYSGGEGTHPLTSHRDSMG